MKNVEHPTIYRKDYRVPPFIVESISLIFQLQDDHTDVFATTRFRKNPDAGEEGDQLFLNGEDLELLWIRCNSDELAANMYQVNEKGLSLTAPGDSFTLEIATRIRPDANTLLEGLYRSNGNYCTQCEAEGFRKITYYIDRPDILAPFTTRIEGNKSNCPVMLSNGNKVDEGELEDGRHYAVWHDPFPKPSYLFALVAGDLRYIEDFFTTKSGRNICLRIYVEERNITKCDHAMLSLKKAMRWDEEVYGLEYDLDIFMIVAVDDFNMGAMENKGLNVFNSKYVLALPETATDNDYLGIEGVVAHEYFHNWTGNRVTCRDWFQLSLKEGLTVFRDQEFSADMNSRPVQRIDDVRILRTGQFREDSGPMAHPVRPDSYVEINNFYTSTVYNKGAEVIRMMHTLLGAEGFRKGMDLYFARHDGQAVTCDDFVASMADANDYDLDQFTRWYSQSGTPVIEVSEHFDSEKEEYSLNLKQSCPPTPGQPEKKPFHLPVAIGLLDQDGKDIRITDDDTLVLELKEAEETFVFYGIEQKPVVSFLRNFSAPVRVKPFQSQEELAFLMAHDSDLYNRCEAAFQLAEQVIFAALEALQAGGQPVLDDQYLTAVSANISGGQNDKALLGQALQLPSETYLAGQMTVIDPDNLHAARNFVKRELAGRLIDKFTALYLENDEAEYQLTPEAMGKRSLKNIALDYLMAIDAPPQEIIDRCLAQYETAKNMTDVVSALQIIANSELDVREEILGDFYELWRNDPLVMDKWLIIQATSKRQDTLDEVKRLMSHPVFSMKNPNKVRSLVGAFCAMNHVRFHDHKGLGYAFLADRIIELNTINPQIGARMVSPFTTWKKYDGERQHMMRDQLERIVNTENLSGDIFEIVKKSL
ncbi:aminopeptidase N [Desulfopila aestuarii]|uniref:Aminopeptidase N n=1 Tax=Desulfopila aestuarii DSM 18488 TaxID=1121416 RepID=A0A1M7Y100_9BACT|nr:aminopeptidase N [Desulfopila aestuarii]SHO45400.1 aminopeptidase N [Desulfopila aestuarii DSM 18488]